MDTFPTHYWHKLPDGRIQCDVCPRNCKLREGQRGLCFVRANIENQIRLTTYGRSSGYCIDPIEKKPLNHFMPGTPVLSFGTAGCNLACKFCQNWDISKSRDMDTLADNAMPCDIALAAKNLGCKSVAFTYNDPVVFMEYAMDVARECHQSEIYSVAVSAGYMNKEPRKEFYAHMDAANIDLKAFSEDFYYKITGSHLQPVLDTLIYLKHETKAGLHYVYTGNVHDTAGSSTYCPSCHVPVIVRDWYQILNYNLDVSGHCSNCHYQLAGVFHGNTGNWGRKRVAVKLGALKSRQGYKCI